MIILVLSTKSDSYLEFKNIWKEFAEKVHHKTILYEGGSDEVKFQNNTLYLTSKDELQYCAEKTFEAIKWVRKTYGKSPILRTNLSSLWEIQGLKNYFLKCQEKNIDYSGVIGTYSPLVERYYHQPKIYKILHKVSFLGFKKRKFISGAGIYLSVNSVDELLKNPPKNGYVDDIYIASVLLQIYGNNILEYQRKDNWQIDEEIKTFFHFKFKSEDRLKDAKNMQILFSKIYS